MGFWENKGETNEWYTPKYVFDALDCRFDVDVAAPIDLTYVSVPADNFIHNDSLEVKWNGFAWCNPPFGKKGTKIEWIDKMNAHGDGIILLPDRSSASWWQLAAEMADCLLQVHGKIKFINYKGEIGKQPSTGTTLFGFGDKAKCALLCAQINNLGIVLKHYS